MLQLSPKYKNILLALDFSFGSQWDELIAFVNQMGKLESMH